jgi:YidC/Oxa1 family membrane protein insertase
MQNIIYPFSLILLFLYNLVDNYGLALILFTIVIKLITLYFSAKSKKSMMKMARLSPKLKEIEARCAGDRQKYNIEVNNFYKSEKVKPTSGCLWTIFPLVIMILLYSIIRQPYTSMFGLSAEQFEILKGGLANIGVNVEAAIGAVKSVYAELPIAQVVHENWDALTALAATDTALADVMGSIHDINFYFLGINLAQVPKFLFFMEEGVWQSPGLWNQIGLFLIPILAGLSQLFASIVSQKSNDSVAQGSSSAVGTTKMMLYMMPLVSVWIAFVMPAGIGIYWIANSVTGMIQEVALTKHYRKVYDAEDAEKARLEAEERAREEARQAERERRAALGLSNTANPNTSKKKLAAQNKKPDKPPQKPLEKMTPKELREYAEELERKMSSEGRTETSDSRVDDRLYARGRNYKADRFAQKSADQTVAEPQEDVDEGGEEDMTVGDT